MFVVGFVVGRCLTRPRETLRLFTGNNLVGPPARVDLIAALKTGHKMQQPKDFSRKDKQEDQGEQNCLTTCVFSRLSSYRRPVQYYARYTKTYICVKKAQMMSYFLSFDYAAYFGMVRLRVEALWTVTKDVCLSIYGRVFRVRRQTEETVKAIGQPEATEKSAAAKPKAKAEPADGQPKVKAEPSSVKPKAKAELVAAKPKAKAEPAAGQPKAKAELVAAKPKAKAEPAAGQPKAKAELVAAKPKAKAEPAAGQPKAKAEPAAAAKPKAKEEPAACQPKAKAEPAAKPKAKAEPAAAAKPKAKAEPAASGEPKAKAEPAAAEESSPAKTNQKKGGRKKRRKHKK